MLASRGTTSAAADDRLAGSVALPSLYRASSACHLCCADNRRPRHPTTTTTTTARMGLGVLEDHKLAHVPGKPLPPQCRSNSTRWMDTLADPVLRIGTATLEDLDPVASLARGNDTSRLKRSKKGVILVPQPSDDPKDPLVCKRQR